MEVILYKNNGRKRIKNVDMSSEYDVKKRIINTENPKFSEQYSKALS